MIKLGDAIEERLADHFLSTLKGTMTAVPNVSQIRRLCNIVRFKLIQKLGKTLENVAKTRPKTENTSKTSENKV